MNTIVFNVITYFHSIFNMSYFHTDWLLGLPVIGMYITGKSSNKSVSAKSDANRTINIIRKQLQLMNI